MSTLHEILSGDRRMQMFLLFSDRYRTSCDYLILRAGLPASFLAMEACRTRILPTF